MFTHSLSHAQSDMESNNPHTMIQAAASETFSRMKNEQALIAQNPEHLRTIMRENLLPHVDYKYSAFMVLGNQARNVPKQQLGEFVNVFREYLVTTYANAMGYYDDQTVAFEPAGDYDDKKIVTVRALIQDTGKPDIKVAFKVRKDRKTNQWAAYDMVAEGISLLSSKRSEFESILRQDGIEKVIELMQQKIDDPIVLQKPGSSAPIPAPQG
ncbi:MAG: ABC transporter substrate-binding protein [Glaciecola sp.]|nr:ABC transporter substrate-binding protein [Glaciecola sp.]MDG2100540.1 ABC transporter substrate-binding protein [Glaciecola sp.]